MPKNKGAGGKNKRKGASSADDAKRELIFKEDGQEYAQVTKMLGGSQVEVYCFEEQIKRKCHIRGKMTKKVWISIGDIILISTRDYEKSVGDVIHKYLPQESMNLKSYGEIPETVKIDGQTGNDKDDDIIFDEDGDVDDTSY